MVFDKIGLADTLSVKIDRIIKLFGFGKSIKDFWKYRDYGKWFKNDFKDLSNFRDILLFPSFLGVNDNFTMVNLMFAKHLLAQNLKPVFLVCRSSVPICQKENVYKTRIHNPFLCHECYNGYRNLSDQTGIEVLYFKDLIDSKEQKLINYEYKKISRFSTLEECVGYTYGNCEIGLYSLKNVLRYYLKGSIKGNDHEIGVFKKYLKSALILTIANEKIFNNNSKIKYSIIHNGTLAFETITRIFCKQANVPYITYENYMGKNTIIYKKNGEIMNFSWEEEYRKYFDSKPITHEIQKKVDQLFSELKVGKHAFGILNKESVNPYLSQFKDYVCIFTNVNFDTAVIGKHSIFCDMTDWLNSVVNFWSENVKDTLLIIRIHPAEVILRSATQDFMGDYLKNIVKTSNVLVIDSTEEVNSYDLIKGMRYGLVYSSTIGMEIAYNNKVCVVAGKPYYRGKNFVISPNSKEEYFEIISQINHNNYQFTIDKNELISFAYFVFYKRLKYLNGLTIYTPNSEKNCIFTNSTEMLSNNITFLRDFESELGN
jgi:hypothetical protein